MRDARTVEDPRSPERRPRTIRARTAVLIVVVTALVAACSGSPIGGGAIPSPSCGSGDAPIAGSLACDRLADIAIETLRERAPGQLARGVTEVAVSIERCPVGEVPPQVDCAGVTHAAMVRVAFGPAPLDGPIEMYLVVAIDPMTGRVLGIVNPLIR
jgi:hypothetical protein